MTLLPLEILRLISQYLPVEDLRQLQLVSREWYEGSIDSLYSNVILGQITQVMSYVNAISNSRKLGICLKTIYVGNYFQKKDKTIIWDPSDLLSTLINCCPNLHEIRCQKPHWILWTRLMLAAYQGKLSNLQSLPSPYVDTESIESYASTALLFKNSLTSLELSDHAGYGDNMVMNSRAFNDLRGHIKEFSKLQHLSVTRYTSQPFNHLDSIIDDCPSLTSLNVSLTQYNGAKPAAKHNLPGLPRPNIRRLTCSWPEIADDDQIKYIMHKFPNLQYIDIGYGSADGVSYNAMMEFIQFMVIIPGISLCVSINREEFTNYWNGFLNLRNELLKMEISYSFCKDEERTTMRYYSNNLLDIELPLYNTDTDLPHINFLKGLGNNIKSLNIMHLRSASEDLDNTSFIKNNIIFNENWIYQTLRACPNLQELTVKDVQLSIPGDDIYQHTKLKKLGVYDEDHLTSLKFLRKFSTHVPNLKELYLYICMEIDSKNNYKIEIDMPNTSFDLITVQFVAELLRMPKHYIVLNINEKKRYFMVDKIGKTQELTYHAFRPCRKNFLFIITCKAIKQFEFIRNVDEPGCTYIGVIKID